MSSRITHIGFADESHWNTGRFRSLGMVTLPLKCLEVMEGEVRRLLSESQVGEFKWKNLDGAKERFAAEKLCTFAVEKACAGQFRVDVLVWDIEDSRHKIAGRDDIANLERMYYHLFRNVLRARWPNNAVWRLCPDEHTALDWETLQDCLENVSTAIEVERSLLTAGQFRIRLRREFGIEEIQPVSSEAHPLLQIADFLPAWLYSRATSSTSIKSGCRPHHRKRACSTKTTLRLTHPAVFGSVVEFSKSSTASARRKNWA